MSKNNLLKFSIVSAIFLFSCKMQPKNENVIGSIIQIDISKDYPLKGISELVSIEREYIPLETSKDVLLGRALAVHYVSENFIVVSSVQSGISVFDRKGKNVSHFDRRGRGPEEYSSLGVGCIVFDEKNEEIFVFDNFRGRMLVYSIMGQFKRVMDYPDDLLLTAYNFDDETLLVYDTQGVLNNDNYRRSPYLLLSKNDGSIKSTLDINFPERYDTRILVQGTDNSGQVFSTTAEMYVLNQRHFGTDFIIGDVSSDTIYKFSKDDGLKPFIIKTPSVHSTNPNMIATPVFITSRFVILYVNVLNYASLRDGKVPQGKNLMYDFNSGEIFTVSHRGSSAVATYLPKNHDVRVLPADLFVGAINNEENLLERLSRSLGIEKNAFLEEIKPFIGSLGEEDNPVIVIEKYK